MIDAVQDDVLAQVQPLLGLGYAARRTGREQEPSARTRSGSRQLLRLKLLSVVEGMAAAVSRLENYPDDEPPLFVRHALLAWADAAKLLEADGAERRTTAVPPHVRSRVRGADASPSSSARQPLTVRRNASRSTDFKHSLYGLVSSCRQSSREAKRQSFTTRSIRSSVSSGSALSRGVAGAGLSRGCDGRDRRAAAMLGTYLDTALRGFGERAYTELERLTAELSEAARDDIRLHYLGFPYWDATTYPARHSRTLPSSTKWRSSERARSTRTG